MARISMADDDAELVALIDNELDESRRTVLLARLAADERLRQRYERVSANWRAARRLPRRAAHASSARAPARRASVDSPVRSAQNRSAGACGLVIGILAAGAAAWVALSLGLLRERQDWRTAVVEYTNLYTNETFSPLNPDASLQAIELRALGARVGVNLTPESVALPGLQFTVAFMLSYNGAPLGVVAYVDPSRRAGLALHHRQ